MSDDDNKQTDDEKKPSEYEEIFKGFIKGFTNDVSKDFLAPDLMMPKPIPPISQSHGVRYEYCPQCHNPWIMSGYVEDDICPACVERNKFDIQMADWLRRHGFEGIRKSDTKPNDEES